MARSPMDMTTRGYGHDYDYDYDYDRTEEVFDDAADLVPLTPSTADHAPENEAAFEEYFSSPESDEDGDETEDEDEDGDRDENGDEDEDRDENEDEDREAESTEPDSLRFEYFFSSSEDEDEDEDEDEIEGFDDEEHSISTEARSGPMSSATRRATAHTHGAVLDDDGGVLRNLFRSDDWEDDDDVSGFDGIGLRGLFRLDSDGESSDEASVQTDQTTRFSRTVEGGEYSSSLSLLLDALSSLARRRARDRTDRDQYFRNNSDGDRDDHAADRNESDRNNDDDDDDDGIDGDYFDYDDDDDINVEEFMLGVVPATKSSIEALEEVTTTTTTSAKDQCAICLEDFSSPIESNGHDYLESGNGDDHDHNHDDQNKVVVVVVLRMPCSHLYHKECIVQWLEKSHLCPLCRYSMPTFDDTASDLSLEETSNAIGMTFNTRHRLVDVYRYAAFGERYRP